jgi:hypothetical protein
MKAVQHNKLTKAELSIVLSLAASMVAASYTFENFALLILSVAPLLWALGRLDVVREYYTTSIISGLLTLAIIDFLLPQFMAHLRPQFSRTYPDGYTQATDLGNQPSPGIHASKSISPAGKIIYNIKYSIGDDGFRITPGNKLGASRRVNFLGCSFTYGEGLNDDETLPYFVVQAMRDVSVKNLGFHGWGVHQALRILEGERDARGDANVLLTAPWQASRSACVHDWNQGSPRYEVSGEKLIRTGKCPARTEVLPRNPPIIGSSNIYQQVAQELNRERGITKDDIDLYLAIIGEIGNISKKRGQKLIIAFIKADEAYLSSSGYSNEAIFKKLQAVGDIAIDVTLAPKSEMLPSIYRLHELDGHPSRVANQERATKIAEALKNVLGP